VLVNLLTGGAIVAGAVLTAHLLKAKVHAVAVNIGLKKEDAAPKQ
jgi:hypothetical protein